MGTIKIINNSVLADYAAIMRIGRFLAGDEYYALHDDYGKVIVSIKKLESNTYVVTDK